MSLPRIRSLFAQADVSHRVLEEFIDFRAGTVTLKHETDMWDYKEDIDPDDAVGLADIAKDVLAFHNTRGGYLILGIADDYTITGLRNEKLLAWDSAKLNDCLTRYTGGRFYVHLVKHHLPVGGTRKTLALIFVPQRKGQAVAAKRNGPELKRKPLFREGDIFIRANDRSKPAQTDSEYELAFSAPREETFLVQEPTLRTTNPEPGYRLFAGDYRQFIGADTRDALVQHVVETLMLDKWDVVSLQGVGGVGKTAVAIEATRRLYEDPRLRGAFGGIISLTAKDQRLTSLDIREAAPEFSTYAKFLYQLLVFAEAPDVPASIDQQEALLKQLLRQRNILLFIDNFETVEHRDTRIARFLSDLPVGCKTLITSRHQPRGVPTQQVDVGPLSDDEAETLIMAEAVEQLIDLESVRTLRARIRDVSGKIPLAIKWIISQGKHGDHLRRIIGEIERGRPRLDALCEFCFSYEYALLSELGRKTLVVFSLFGSAPTRRELAVALDVPHEELLPILDELVRFSLVSVRLPEALGEEVYSLLPLTLRFAQQKTRDFLDLDLQARSRLRAYYGRSIPELMASAADLARQGKVRPAEKQLHDVLDRDQSNFGARFQLAEVLQSDGRVQEAITQYAQSLDDAAIDPAFRDSIALRLNELLLTPEDRLSALKKAFHSSQSPTVGLEIIRLCDQIHDAGGETYAFELLGREVGQAVYEFAAHYLIRHLIRRKEDARARRLCDDGLQVHPSSRLLIEWRKFMRRETDYQPSL